MFGISDVEKQDGSSHDRATNATPKDSGPCCKFGSPQSTIFCNRCHDQTTVYDRDMKIFMDWIGGKSSTGPAAAIKLRDGHSIDQGVANWTRGRVQPVEPPVIQGLYGVGTMRRSSSAEGMSSY